MNKVFKKIIAVTLCVAAMVPAMTACDNSGKDEIPTLVWYLPGSKAADIAIVNEAVNKITAEKIGAKIDIQFIDDAAYPERMSMNMASRSEFDICFTGYVNNYDDAVRRGAFLDITKMLEGTKLKEALPDYAWESVEIDGKIYAVPNQQTFTQTLGLLFRKDLVEKYNFDYTKVEKMQDLEPYLQTIKENEKDVYPIRQFKFEYLMGDKYEALNALGSMAYLKRDGSNKIIALSDIPEVKEFADLSHSWFNKGYLRPDIATVKNDNTEMYAGKYAVWGQTFKPGVVEEEQNKMANSIELVGVNLQTPYMTRFFATATMYAISATSKHPEEAFKFIELLQTNKELYNIICWGIEGKHYDKLEDGRIHVKPDSGYYYNQSWKFGNCFNSYILDDQNEDVWIQTMKENETADRSPILGLALDNTKIRTEVANCSSIVSEYAYMKKGYTDPETYFKEYQSRLREAGIDKIADEAQKQVDEYLSTK